MEIEFWDCKYIDYHKIIYQNEKDAIFFCDHKNSEDGYCHINNKFDYSNLQAKCPLLKSLKKYETGISY